MRFEWSFNDIHKSPDGSENYCMPAGVKEDMQIFFERIASEEVDLKQLGIRGKTKDSIVNQLIK